jgi:hypothetical protein
MCSSFCKKMKSITLLLWLVLPAFGVSGEVPESLPAAPKVDSTVAKLPLSHPFRIFLTDEVLLTHHTGAGGAVSHWTKQIASRGNFERKYADRFDATVLNNGFLEVTNGDEVLLIPMEKVVAIRVTRGNENQEAEQAGAGQPATRSESKSEGDQKPEPESEGRSR